MSMYINICGNLIARIGHMEDYVLYCRAAIDVFVNRHGETFLVSLKDSKMCVLNGRLNP